MNEAEEYLISLEYDGNEVIETNQDAKNGRADYVSKLMESYHQSRVKSISDEIDKIIATKDPKNYALTYWKCYNIAVKIKDKLLKP